MAVLEEERAVAAGDGVDVLYLSRLVLNLRNGDARRALGGGGAATGDLHALHRLVWRGFAGRHVPGDDAPSGVLWRLDEHPGTGTPYLLVQSAAAPHWLPWADNGPFATAECKEFRANVSSGQLLRFRLRATPTKRDKASGKRVGLYSRHPDPARREAETDAVQRAWLERKAEGGGFSVVEARLQSLGGLTGRRPEEQDISRAVLTYTAVDFDGMLRVTDPGRFRGALASGIGSGKAFGFGLLSVARAV